jgi:selenocysteine lyase/cysteine desulfurase
MRIILERLGPSGAPRGLRLLGPEDVESRVGVFSFVHESLSPIELADALEHRFGILTRPGLHCAPLAHRSLGTAHSGGAVRLSVGPFVTEDDAAYAADSLVTICAEAGRTSRPAPIPV